MSLAWKGKGGYLVSCTTERIQLKCVISTAFNPERYGGAALIDIHVFGARVNCLAHGQNDRIFTLSARGLDTGQHSNAWQIDGQGRLQSRETCVRGQRKRHHLRESVKYKKAHQNSRTRQSTTLHKAENHISVFWSSTHVDGWNT